MAASKFYYVTQGFLEDCTTLIDRFDKLETVRFEGFAEIWKDMKFSLVFGGKRWLGEQKQFCEDCLVIAKEFFLESPSFKEQIGGLYLLYGLYFKMPVEGPKIRVTMDDWQDILEFRAEIEQAEHHDASYILAKLLSANAFYHCPLEREYGLERTFRLKVAKVTNPYSVLGDIRDMAGWNGLFQRVDKLSKIYGEAKKQECGGAKSLELYDSNFGTELLESVAKFENSRKSENFGHNRVLRPELEGKVDRCQHSLIDGEKKPLRYRYLPRGMLGHAFNTDSSEESEDEPSNVQGSSSFPDLILSDSS